ncbi:MAG: type II toxin-antitoxin system RelE/ParE family toxin [Hyphomicrobiales bacterium]
MKKELKLTDQAKADLRNIRDYIAEDSPHNAQIFIAELTAKILFIAEADFSGSSRDHLSEGLRALPFKRRCIYFRSYPDSIVIVRVLHGSQDVAARHFSIEESST